jgi:hypothetical protein
VKSTSLRSAITPQHTTLGVSAFEDDAHACREGGRLTIHLRDRDITLAPGEIFVVPRGVEHCPDAVEETEVLLIEPDGTVNTGDAGGDMTAEPLRL